MINGLHHITAFCGDPQANVDFYVGVLGLRLIKVTINYDDPGTYHLYYGDEKGSPGSILTFFPWQGSPQGKPGLGQAGVTRFSVPAGSLEAWALRLGEAGLISHGPFRRLDEDVLATADPDGMMIELVASDLSDDRMPWTEDGVPNEMAIRGFHSVELWSLRPASTENLLRDTLGWREIARDETRSRWAMGEGGHGQIADVLLNGSQGPGRMGPGAVHHVAWSITDDAAQAEWLQKLQEFGAHVSPIYDRTYFHSIYFREPGGILFEIATERPGFTVDEPLESLGEKLQLPAWLEPNRDRVAAALPKFMTQRGVAFPG